jgi:hypothetical protein
MSESVARNRLTEEILSHVYSHQHSAVRRELEKRTLAHLEETLATVLKEARENLAKSESALENERAQRSAEKAAFDLQHNKPQRDAATKEQTEQDRLTFELSARTLRSFGQTDANLSMIKDSLGAGFSLEQVKAFCETNGNLLSPPSVHERNSWEFSDAQERKAAEAQRVVMLKNMPHEQLREEVRKTGQQAHQQSQIAHVQQQVQAMEEKCSGQFPDIPSHNADGQALDSSYFIKLSNSPYGTEPYLLWKRFIRKHGFANMTARLQGVR